MVTTRDKVTYSDTELYTTGPENPDIWEGINYSYVFSAKMYTAGQPLMISGTDRVYTPPTPWWQLYYYFVIIILLKT